MTTPVPEALTTTSNPPVRLRANEVIRRLTRFQALELHSARLIGGWLPGVARWEYKHEIARHLWQDAQHSRELRTRLWELRVTRPDRAGDPVVTALVHGLATAQEDFELLSGLYLVFKYELVAAYREILAGAHEVYDAPTVAMVGRLLVEKEAQLAWAAHEMKAWLDNGEKQQRAARWMEYLRRLIVQLGGLTGSGAIPAAEVEPPPPGYSCPLPFSEARRDDRFKITLAGAPLPKDDDRAGRVLFQFFNYTQEMQAAETLGSMLWEADGMDWEFYYDVARHCYDEERHSALGETRLRQLGHHVSDFPNYTASYAWRQLYDPLRRYCVLTYVIEADSFSYKHLSYREHLRNDDMESAEAVLYDIIDETNHVRFGQKWVPRMMEQYKHAGSLEALVGECRTILIENSINPLQRACAEQNQKSA